MPYYRVIGKTYKIYEDYIEADTPDEAIKKAEESNYIDFNDAEVESILEC